MPSKVYRRPRPLQVSAGMTFTNGVGNVNYYSMTIGYPGIWRIECIGGGGGGGGYDTFYQQRGEAGKSGTYSVATITATQNMSAGLGMGGANGASSSGGGANGTSGGTSFIGGITGAGGVFGRGGNSNTNYNRVPSNSPWPYGGEGRGGYGRDGSSTDNISGVSGAVRARLVG